MIVIQVHPEGTRHIRSGGRKEDWAAKTTVVKAAVNTTQVVLGLAGGVLKYFELDETGQLIEIEKKEMGQDITSLDVAPIQSGRARSRFLTVRNFLFLATQPKKIKFDFQLLTSLHDRICLPGWNYR